jgi:hypothetical protein
MTTLTHILNKQTSAPIANSSNERMIKQLIPDLLPNDHISMNMKRIRFIQGQGVIIYDNSYAVEIYLPRDGETPTYFGVHKHHNNMNELRADFPKLDIMEVTDNRTTELMKLQFSEAVMQFLPLAINEQGWIVPAKIINRKEGKEITMLSNISGAA